ncbi:stemmadenine O-acetyltransferase-like [Ipomoea triloba]|uniref:stemmadenine O-acetyltransferase-like n=1 Tax=Ipomoea triloba TaxID=35885 RepID=UPI00125D01DD|nr:stemmadenine O-acetyltransferase-like [Ipomoea triloba]
MFKVELLSKEMMIKPSSPTPPHLKTLKLSFLDQISPPVFIPLIFFFHNHGEDDHGRSSQKLKQSLSKVLSLFYPLAGRLKGNDFIDCSDDGALWVEARVHGFLKDVVENPLMEELEKFLPAEPYNNGDDGELILAVQINYFLDGGIAVGVCMSHKIGDGLSLVNFVNAWAVAAREGHVAGISPPDFELPPSLFPPTTADLSGSGFSPSVGMTREKIVTRRVVFSKEKLAALKKSAAARVSDPTRVEALSAFLWSAAGRKKPQNPSAAVHAVNLRSRMNPPLPDLTFGNLWRPAIAVTSPETTQDDLVSHLRTSIRKINAEHAKALQNCHLYLENLHKAQEMFCKGEAEFCSFSSWCRFPIYEVDFGWGRPVWACTTTFPYKNVIILMSTKSGDGIEAWVNIGD